MMPLELQNLYHVPAEDCFLLRVGQPLCAKDRVDGIRPYQRYVRPVCHLARTHLCNQMPHPFWGKDHRVGKDLIVHFNKSGYVFVLDKNTGNIENVWPISDLKNFVKDIDRKTGNLIERVDLTMNKETLICPSTFGARSWNSGAYNPKTGLWYNNVLEFCGYLKPVEQKVDPKDYGTGHTGSNDFGRLVMAPDGRKPGKLSANDPLTGERKWSVDMDVPGFACVLTTGGGLVFNGDPMGKLQAHDADTGKVLWSFNTGSGMRGGIVSYAVDGEQYILVASGWGSYAAILMPALLPQLEKVPAASTLIAFKVSK